MSIRAVSTALGLLFSLLFMVLNGIDVFAADGGPLVTATIGAADQYASEIAIDASRADDRAFGFATEIHGTRVRVRFYDLSVPNDLTERVYSCVPANFHASACRRLAPIPGKRDYHGEARFSLAQIRAAFLTVANLVSSGGRIDPSQFAFAKLWQEGASIRVNLGYEIRALEDSYVCEPSPSALTCRLATAPPVSEP